MEAILAIDINNGLSKNGKIAWDIKEDMKFFYNKTINNVVIMGKNTFLSIPNFPLKNRLNIVLTSDNDLLNKKIDNVIFSDNIKIIDDINNYREKYNKLYSFLKNDFKIILIGGKQIYEKYINLCNIIWITTILDNYNCDMNIDISNILENYKYEIIRDEKEFKIICYYK
jgi:dihydrofolate reductase